MIWTAGRNQQLGELIAEVFQAAGPVPREYRAVIAGGPPGADKADALAQHGADPSQFLTISVGDVLTGWLAASSSRGAGSVPAGRSRARARRG